MTQESTKSKGDGLSDARVSAYLRDNPDFLARNPDVLRLLVAPDRELGDGISDMQTAMIGQLRSEVTRLKARQDDIVLTSRANLSTQPRVHGCVLAVLGAGLVAVVISDSGTETEAPTASKLGLTNSGSE